MESVKIVIGNLLIIDISVLFDFKNKKGIFFISFLYD